MFVYSLKKPAKYKDKIKTFNHSIFILENTTFLVPKKVDSKHVNPESFLGLKNQFKIKKILIEDRVKGCKKNCCIMDHINKSGFNFLFNKTPFKTFPTFPDMSRIYNPLNNLEQVVVQTIGIKSFSKKIKKEGFFSEIIGLVSPVWHYVDVKVFGKGV
jgi:hypothetical protein